MVIEPAVPKQGIMVETEALKALVFYANNYTTLVFARPRVGQRKNCFGKQTF